MRDVKRGLTGAGGTLAQVPQTTIYSPSLWDGSKTSTKPDKLRFSTKVYAGRFCWGLYIVVRRIRYLALKREVWLNSMRKRIVDVRCERVTRILIYTCIGLIYKEKRTLSAFYVRSSCVGVRVTLICIMWHDGACGRIGHQALVEFWPKWAHCPI